MAIFRNTGRSMQVYTLSDATLFRAMCVGIFVLWTFLTVWMIIAPPKPVLLDNGVSSYTMCQSKDVSSRLSTCRE